MSLCQKKDWRPSINLLKTGILFPLSVIHIAAHWALSLTSRRTCHEGYNIIYKSAVYLSRGQGHISAWRSYA